LKKIYLDVCSLCRPFDDQSFIRIRLETDAVNLIMAYVQNGVFKLLASPVHLHEISAISDIPERIQLEMLLEKEAEQPQFDRSLVKQRTEELLELGFGLADAAHVAFAEIYDADFISCDDKLLNKCSKSKIQIWTGNPIVFCDKEKLK